jgi:hypothetical protein
LRYQVKIASKESIMTKHIERLMSRASVAAMAAFAPKPDPASTVPAFAERVEDEPAGGGDRAVDPIDGLSAEEQAGLDAMRQGEPPSPEGAEGDAGGSEGADGDGDGEGDDPGGDPDPAPAAADGAPAPRQPKTINYGRHQKEIAKLAKERDEAIAALA